jgi:hypothetical protein
MRTLSRDDRGRPVHMSFSAIYGSSRREPELQSAVRAGRVPAYFAAHRAWQVAFAKYMGVCTLIQVTCVVVLVWIVPALLNSTAFSGPQSILVRINDFLTPAHIGSPSRVAYVVYVLYPLSAFGFPSLACVFLWRFIGGRAAMQRMLLLLRICPACDFSLREIEPQADGCTVCPECGAAWKILAGALQSSRQGQQPE